MTFDEKDLYAIYEALHSHEMGLSRVIESIDSGEFNSKNPEGYRKEALRVKNLILKIKPYIDHSVYCECAGE